MRRRFHPELLSLALALVASSAVASGSSFSVMDVNRDGQVTPREHADAARQMFIGMDTNRDGIVTAEEMDAARFMMRGRPVMPGELTSAEKIKVIDGNADGSLSAAEHAAGAQRMFATMDADRDGVLTRDELDAGHARMLQK